MKTKRMDQTVGPDWGEGEEIYLEFAVQDTGRGLSPEELGVLFQRFQQASPRTHVQYGGSGLGLFISRELTELQGGEIGVSSESGRGSTFAFYVKCRRCVEAGEAAESASSMSSARNPWNNKDKQKAIEPPKVKDFAAVSGSKVAPKAKPQMNGLKVLIVEDNLGMFDHAKGRRGFANCQHSEPKGSPTSTQQSRHRHTRCQPRWRSTRSTEELHILGPGIGRRTRPRRGANGQGDAG